MKREILLKHARHYGYYLIPRKDLYDIKYKHIYEKKKEFYN